MRVPKIALVVAMVCLSGPILASPRPDTEEPEKPEQEEKKAEGDKEERDEGPKRLQWSANVRFRLSASETDESDDTESDTSEARIRLRGGLAWIISKPLDFKIRFAGSVSSEENDYSFEVDTTAPLATGKASFDELFLKWGPT